MNEKILVTGGTGYIGSHTTVELQKAGYEVVIIDNLSNSNIEVLDGIEKITGIRPVFVKGDCTDIEALRRYRNRFSITATTSTLSSICSNACRNTV